MSAHYVPPYAIFRKMPDFARCAGSFLDVGAPVVAPPDRTGTYVVSIGEIVDRSGKLLGWIYLASEKGVTSTIVNLREGATPGELRAAGLRMPASSSVSSFATLGPVWPWPDLHAVPCRDIQLPNNHPN